MATLFQINKRIFSISITLNIIVSLFLTLFLFSINNADAVSGQDLIVTNSYEVNGSETWDNVRVRDGGMLIIPNNTKLYALTIVLESGSKLYVSGGEIKISSQEFAAELFLKGNCDVLSITNNSIIKIIAPSGGNKVGISRGGNALLNVISDEKISIENSTIELKGGDGYTLPQSTTSKSNAWTTDNLGGDVSGGGDAKVSLSLKNAFSKLEIYNSTISVISGPGGNASDGGYSTDNTGYGGGYSNGGHVSGHVGTGGMAEIHLDSKRTIEIKKSILNSNGRRGGHAGNGGKGGNVDNGAGGGGYCGGNGGVDYSSGYAGSVSGHVGSGGSAKIEVNSTNIEIIESQITTTAGSGGNAGNGGEGGYGVGSGGGGGGYGGGGGGGFGINGDGADTSVSGYVGSGGNASISIMSTNLDIETSQFILKGGFGGTAGDGGDPGDGNNIHGQGGGGGYGGGGGAGSGTGGNTIIGDFIGTGGSASINVYSGDHVYFNNSSFSLNGGNGGDGGSGGAGKGSSSGAGGGGLGGGGGGDDEIGKNVITGNVSDGGNAIISIYGDTLNILDNNEFNLIQGMGGNAPDSPGGGPGGGEGKGRNTSNGKSEFNIPTWAPILMSPINGQTFINSTPTFIWKESTNFSINGSIKNYNLIVDDNLSFQNPEYNIVTASESFDPIINLSSGIYNWRVKVNYLINQKTVGIWSNTKMFQIIDDKPRIINFQKSKERVYRNHSIVFYINGSDIKYSESELTCQIQFSPQFNQWLDILDVSYHGKTPNGFWVAGFTPLNSYNIGKYQIRCRFINSDLKYGSWKTDNFTVMNNVPKILEIKFLNDSIYRTEYSSIIIDAYDVETMESSLTCECQITSPTGINSTLTNKKYISNHWELFFMTDVTSELGLFDIKINIKDPEGASSGWINNENVIEVKNNLPEISRQCDDFNVMLGPLEIDLTKFELDIEDHGEDLTWRVDLDSVNEELFTVIMVDISNDIIRIVPEDNAVGSDDITLILTDKDGGTDTKNNVTINVFTKQDSIYRVKISVIPDYLEIKQGQTKNVTIIIENLGTVRDFYQVDYEFNDAAWATIELNKSPFFLEPGWSTEFTVSISVKEKIKTGKYELNFLIMSDNAFNITNLSVNVIEKDNPNNKQGSNIYDSTSFYGILGLIAIIIIIALLVLFVSTREKSTKKINAPIQPSEISEGIFKKIPGQTINDQNRFPQDYDGYKQPSEYSKYENELQYMVFEQDPHYPNYQFQQQQMYDQYVNTDYNDQIPDNYGDQKRIRRR